jgi:long-chain acyl-CoA synthetase
MSKNFVCFLEETARRSPEKPAVSCGNATLSYRELHARASQFANSLARDGVRAGDRVAVVLPNHWSFVVAILGIWKLGATVVPLSSLLKTGEERVIIDDVQPVRTIKGIDPVGEGKRDTLVECEAPALIGYSSGSTGRPKGAVFSHAALAFADHSWADMMGVTPADVVLSALPLPHSFGLHGSLLAPLLTGAQVVILDRFSPEAVLEAMARYRVTLFLGVATMFRRLLSAPAFASTDPGSLRLSVSGAAPCPWELAEEWRRRTGNRILRGYGMTELFRPISYLAREADDRPESIGRAVPGVETQVRSEVNSVGLDDAAGELWIKTPAALERYWNDPEETRAVLVDGWFRTGDLARISSDGFVEIVGRVKERILRGGYSVFPQEVESVLVTHQAIAEAAVVPVPHPDLGEEVGAFVVLKGSVSALPEEIVEFCKARLARFKYPRQIRFLAELPRSPSGKVLKNELPPFEDSQPNRDSR